jgi:CRP-like cAMP-binding protein
MHGSPRGAGFQAVTPARALFMPDVALTTTSSPCLLNVRGRNRLLTLLPPDELARIGPLMERRTYERGDVLYRAQEPIQFVYLPLYGVGSLLIFMQDGASVEVGTVGNEGLIGLPVVHGADSTQITAVFQSPAEAMLVRAADFRNELARNPALNSVVHRYAQGFMNQSAQSSACNRLHEVEQRMSRWVLMTHDRVGEDKLELTQEFLAAMLGVRRATVNLVARILQRAGLIRYQRGQIIVTDRKGLEATTCECYWVVRREYERLLC